jgi:hypothetical protein
MMHLPVFLYYGGDPEFVKVRWGIAEAVRPAARNLVTVLSV